MWGEYLIIIKKIHRQSNFLSRYFSSLKGVWIVQVGAFFDR